MQFPLPAKLSLVVTLSAVAVPLSGQEARVIQPYGLYPAGTLLTAPLTGVTFRLPDGFRAEWDDHMGGLLTLSENGALGGVWGWSEGTVAEVAAEIGARLEAQGFALVPREEIELSDQALRGIFDSSSDGVRGVIHAAIQVGPRGGVVAVVGIGQPRVETTARAFVDHVTSSLEWSVPAVEAWREQLGGAVLDSATGALAFCGQAEYRYRKAGTDGTLSDEHEGRWGLVADLAGRPTLFLQAGDGRAFGWSLQRSDDGFLIDGQSYRVTGRCPGR